MIPGTKPRKVTRYLPIDHCGDGFGWVVPAAGEKYQGIPYGFMNDNSAPYIEVLGDKGVFRTINALDCSEIEFD